MKTAPQVDERAMRSAFESFYPRYWSRRFDTAICEAAWTIWQEAWRAASIVKSVPEGRAEGTSGAVRDVDHSEGQGASRADSETSAAFSVRAVKDHP